MSLHHATLHQLKIFNALAQHMSMARTAEALHLTPPAVSIQVRQLSEAVGQALIEQIGKQIYLTEAGQSVALACRDIFDRIENLEQELAMLDNLERGRVRVAILTTAKYFIPRMLGDFTRDHPGAELSLFIGNRKAVLERLAKNADDIYILGQLPEKIKVEAIPFACNRLIAVAHPQHPLKGKRGIPLEKLEKEKFIIREQGSGIRMATEMFFRNNKCKLNAQMELGSNEAIKQCVMAGLGISVMSEMTVQDALDSGELVKLDVKGLPIKRTWYIIHPAQKSLSRLAEAFKTFLVSQNSESTPG